MAVLWPSGEAQREAPPADASEEMALGIAAQLVGSDVLNGTFVHNSGWYVFMLDEFADPCRRARVVFVVEVHGATIPGSKGCSSTTTVATRTFFACGNTSCSGMASAWRWYLRRK
jgi:hypothetical protein